MCTLHLHVIRVHVLWCVQALLFIFYFDHQGLAGIVHDLTQVVMKAKLTSAPYYLRIFLFYLNCCIYIEQEGSKIRIA